MKFAGKSKQVDLMRNIVCREKPHLYHVIDIGCIFSKSAKMFFYINARAQMYHFNILLCVGFISELQRFQNISTTYDLSQSIPKLFFIRFSSFFIVQRYELGITYARKCSCNEKQLSCVSLSVKQILHM